MFHLDRRQLLRGLAAAGTLGSLTFAAEPRDRQRIKAENDREGTTDWQLTYTRVDPKTKYRSPLIEGYCSKTSVRPGEKIDVFVSTDPATPFTLDVYRLGYYQGKGGRQLLHLGPLDGKVEATAAGGGGRPCGWQL